MANIDKKFIDWYTLQRPDIFLSSYGKEMALQAYKRGPPSLVYMLQQSLQHVSSDDIVIVGKHAIRIFDDFQFSLFDFPHLSSFNACEELDHLIIFYLPPSIPRTHEYWWGGTLGGVSPITMVAPPSVVWIRMLGYIKSWRQKG